MIQLAAQDLQLVITILQQYIPHRKVLAFGSRVTGTNKPYADLDLCIMGDEPLSWTELAKLRTAFSDSNLTIHVDLVDWATISAEFKNIILAQYQEIV